MTISTRLLIWLVFCLACSSVMSSPSQTSMSGWMDSRSDSNINNIEDRADWTPFTGWKSWGFGPEPVWVRVSLPASPPGDASPLVLVVRPSRLDHITFFDPAMGLERRAGNHWPVSQDAMGSILLTFEAVASEQKRDVYLRLQSNTARVIHVSVLPLAEARIHTRIVEWTTGAMLVLSMVFCVWAMVQWLLTRIPIMGVFAIKQGFVTAWGFLFLGFGRLTLGPYLPEGVLSVMSSMIGALMVAAVLWFFSVLLQDFQAKSWMLRVLRAFAILMGGLSLLNLLGQTQLSLQILHTLIPFVLAWMLLSLITAPTEIQPPIPKSALLVFLIFYSIFNAIPPLVYKGWLEGSMFMFIGNIGLLVLSGLFMLVLLKVRQVRIDEKQNALVNQVLIHQEQSRLHQQHLEDQRKLLVMLAHEMRTPLANLRTWMEAGPKGRSAMERAITDMSRIMDRCVQAGQLQDHHLRPQNEWLDVLELTLGALESSREPTRVQLNLPDDVCPALVDEQMLSIVLSNLLENAYKYSDRNTPIVLNLSPHQHTDGRDGWKWSLENDAAEIGLPEADKVFDKYYRSANAQRQSGSGLGLFLVKSLVELMQGQVTYKSKLHRVQFEVWVPTQASPGSAAD